MIVTIDGPAGTGKSTVARRLAVELQFEFLDTGAMYRMVALKSLRELVNLDSNQELTELTHGINTDLSSGQYLMDGEDVTSEIRTSEVTRAASIVAQIPGIREILVQRQRDFAGERNVVCEGRDQGTVAFPHAECKFFLTADAEERAKRRAAELEAIGRKVDFQSLLAEQISRDQRDAARQASPLKPAEDALLIDTTDMNLDDVVEMLKSIIKSKCVELQN